MAQQAPPQAAVQRAQAGAPVPATHVVQQGETLWALAQQFLGDPLLWPEIYRLNTTTIEDPHWIFPGEELHLAPVPDQASAAAPSAPSGASTQVTPEAPSAPAQGGEISVAPAAADTEPAQAQQGPVVNPTTGTTIFATQGRARISAGTFQLREQQGYRAVREGEYYSAGYVLDQGEQLNAGRLLGNTQTSSISRLATATSTSLYGTVSVVPPPGDSVRKGDLLLCYDSPRMVPNFGALIRPTGLLKVTKVGAPGENVMAQVLAVYQTIDGGQGVIKAVPYQSPRGLRPTMVPADSGVQGEVIEMRAPREVVNDQDVLYINRGAADGVHLGDVFQVSKTSPTQSEIGAIVQNQAKVLIVYVRDHTSTGMIIQLDRPDIRPGAVVRQVRRMPS
jgi:LysM domain